MDEFRDMIIEALGKLPGNWSEFVPAKEMAMGEWKEVVGRLEEIVREDFESPEFSLSTGAVRTCFNRSLTDLAQLIDHQLKLEDSTLDDTVVAL